MRFESGSGGRSLPENQGNDIALLDLTYIYNAGFADELLTPADALGLLPDSSTSKARGYPAPNESQPDYFHDVHNKAEPPIKDSELERRLFYVYNYLKWQAASLRDELMGNQQSPHAAELTAHIRQYAEAAVKMEDYLFRANLGLLVKMARGSSEHYSDGAIGLLKAIRIFELERRIRFSTIAVRCIQQAIWNGWKKARGSREISFAELPSDVASLEISHEELVEGLERQELLGIVLEELMQAAHLSRRERDMLELRYGIKLIYEEGLKEIASKYEVTHERVRQILVAAVEKLKKAAELRPIHRNNL